MANKKEVTAPVASDGADSLPYQQGDSFMGLPCPQSGGDNYSYANDYEIITKLKQFADSYGICILLVHHTRKQGSDDKFDMISGTTGLLGRFAA